MQVGSFGDVIFSVSTDKIQTVKDVSRSGSASIQTHKRHLDVDLPEFVGTDLESLSFNIQISKYLGVANPQTEVDRLFSYMRNGNPKYFILGAQRYGRYKWLISKIKVTDKHYDKSSNAITVDLAVTLTEYPQR